MNKHLSQKKQNETIDEALLVVRAYYNTVLAKYRKNPRFTNAFGSFQYDSGPEWVEIEPTRVYLPDYKHYIDIDEDKTKYIWGQYVGALTIHEPVVDRPITDAKTICGLADQIRVIEKALG